MPNQTNAVPVSSEQAIVNQMFEDLRMFWGGSGNCNIFELSRDEMNFTDASDVSAIANELHRQCCYHGAANLAGYAQKEFELGFCTVLFPCTQSITFVMFAIIAAVCDALSKRNIPAPTLYNPMVEWQRANGNAVPPPQVTGGGTRHSRQKAKHMAKQPVGITPFDDNVVNKTTVSDATLKEIVALAKQADCKEACEFYQTVSHKNIQKILKLLGG